MEEAKFKNKIKYYKKRKCIDSKGNLGIIKTQHRIGTDSINGEVLKSISKGLDLAIKKIPLSNYDLQFVNKPFKLHTLINSSTFSEVYFLTLLNSLSDQNKGINFPYIYKYFICNNCEFQNKDLDSNHKNVDKCVLVVTGLYDMDFKMFLKKKLNISYIFNAILQIFIGIYTIRRYFNIWHHDLHYGNILVKKIQPGGFWKYIIKGKEIIVPNLGYKFVLWDFGYASIPGVIENENLKYAYQKNNLYDYLHAVGNLPDSRIYNKLKNVISNLLKYNGPVFTIQKLSEIQNELTGELLETFNIDSKLLKKKIKVPVYLD